VLEALGFLVDFVPLHAEDFAEHALDEVVAQGGAVGGFAAGLGEAHDAVFTDGDEAVALEALEGHGHGRRGNFKPVREHGGNYLMALGFSFEDGLEVILFGYVDGVFHGFAAYSLIRLGGREGNGVVGNKRSKLAVASRG